MSKSLRVHLGSALAVALAIGGIVVSACVGDDLPVAALDGGSDGPTNLEDRLAIPADAPGDAPIDAGSDGDAALRKCQTIVAPPAPNDFFCADFDGVSLVEGWTRTNSPDAGTLSLTQAVYSSAPSALNALGSLSDGGARRGSMLEWEKLGATTIREIDLKFDFNPVAPGGVVAPTTGDIEIAEVQAGGTGNATITYSLRHTRGKNVTGSGPHYGLYLQSSAVGGAAVLTNDLITTQPVPGSFTTVRLLATSSGSVTITFNGIQIFSKTLYSFTESRAFVTLGAATNGQTAISETFRFDNVIVQVNRN